MLVGEKFDGGIGEDTQKGGRVATEEPAYAVLPVDVSHCRYHAEPRAGIFGKLWVRGLEENLNAV